MLRAALSILIAFLAGGAYGQSETTAFSWDCWIGEDSRQYSVAFIRCMPDRDPLPPPDALTADPNTELQDHAHRLLHQGAISELETLYKTNLTVFREGRVWNIRIYRYPSESSWDQSLPELLVRSLLCGSDSACKVMVRRE